MASGLLRGSNNLGIVRLRSVANSNLKYCLGNKVKQADIERVTKMYNIMRDIALNTVKANQKAKISKAQTLDQFTKDMCDFCCAL